MIEKIDLAMHVSERDVADKLNELIDAYNNQLKTSLPVDIGFRNETSPPK